jgi:hypothetical protein
LLPVPPHTKGYLNSVGGEAATAFRHPSSTTLVLLGPFPKLSTLSRDVLRSQQVDEGRRATGAKFSQVTMLSCR